jgi:hypothetical protein
VAGEKNGHIIWCDQIETDIRDLLRRLKAIKDFLYLHPGWKKGESPRKLHDAMVEGPRVVGFGAYQGVGDSARKELFFSQAFRKHDSALWFAAEMTAVPAPTEQRLLLIIDLGIDKLEIIWTSQV